MGKVKMPSGGGLHIKNAVEDVFYAETGEIGSGNFVQFVRSGALYNGAQSVSGNFYYTSAVQVSDTRFILYYTNSAGETAIHRYLSLFEVDGASIRIVSTVTVSISNSGRSMYDVDIEKVSDSKFIITYVNASNRLFARIVVVSGDSISLGTAVQVNSNPASIDTSSRNRVTVLSENKAVIFFRPNADNGRTYYAVSLSVSGTTITIKSTITAFTMTDTGMYFGNAHANICKIDNGRACIMVTDYDGSTYYVKVAVLSVSDSYAMTVGAFVSLTNGNLYAIVGGGGGVMLVPIDNTRVLAIYNGSSYIMVARVLTITASNTISAGTALSAGPYIYASSYMDAILFDENTIIVCGRTSSGNKTILSVVLNISGTVLTKGITYSIGYGDNFASLTKSGDRFIVLVPPANSGLLYYDMPTTKAVNIAKPYVNSVWGVSKTKATTLKPGKAFFPKA